MLIFNSELLKDQRVVGSIQQPQDVLTDPVILWSLLIFPWPTKMVDFATEMVSWT